MEWHDVTTVSFRSARVKRVREETKAAEAGEGGRATVWRAWGPWIPWTFIIIPKWKLSKDSKQMGTSDLHFRQIVMAAIWRKMKVSSLKGRGPLLRRQNT